VIEIADIREIAGCRAVVAVQEAVWGNDGEIVPASLLVVSAKRGGILLGAYSDDELCGFVWSMPGWRDGQPTHWSHLLAVLPAIRHRGVGTRLKLVQRERALATPAEVIEWTFDPLQAGNAHLNLSVLGCVATEYRIDVYGPLRGALHRGTPTDRLVAEWRIREPHVERRLAARAGAAVVARDHSVLQAPLTIALRRSEEWLLAGEVTTPDAPRVLIPVPPRFTEMQAQATVAALAWRMATRQAFQTYLRRGYRVVDFFLDKELGGGRYLLARLG
jgi:predicted GNAT superfamily acetyltransferase